MNIKKRHKRRRKTYQVGTLTDHERAMPGKGFSRLHFRPSVSFRDFDRCVGLRIRDSDSGSNSNSRGYWLEERNQLDGAAVSNSPTLLRRTFSSVTRYRTDSKASRNLEQINTFSSILVELSSHGRLIPLLLIPGSEFVAVAMQCCWYMKSRSRLSATSSGLIPRIVLPSLLDIRFLLFVVPIRLSMVNGFGTGLIRGSTTDSISSLAEPTSSSVSSIPTIIWRIYYRRSIVHRQLIFLNNNIDTHFIASISISSNDNLHHSFIEALINNNHWLTSTASFLFHNFNVYSESESRVPSTSLGVSLTANCRWRSTSF